jgi:hypothetical protein
MGCILLGSQQVTGEFATYIRDELVRVQAQSNTTCGVLDRNIEAIRQFADGADGRTAGRLQSYIHTPVRTHQSLR